MTRGCQHGRGGRGRKWVGAETRCGRGRRRDRARTLAGRGWFRRRGVDAVQGTDGTRLGRGHSFGHGRENGGAWTIWVKGWRCSSGHRQRTRKNVWVAYWLLSLQLKKNGIEFSGAPSLSKFETENILWVNVWGAPLVWNTWNKRYSWVNVWVPTKFNTTIPFIKVLKTSISYRTFFLANVKYTYFCLKQMETHCIRRIEQNSQAKRLDNA